jgi:stage V sporulation protein B
MSLAITLVPAISEAESLKNYRAVNNRISRSIQISTVMGFIFMAIFISYHNEISTLIYRRENIGELLFLLSFTCVLIYLFQTLTGVLNGLGKQGILLRNSVAGSVVRIAAVYFAIPIYGIKSYIWGMIISFGLMCVLNLHTVIKATGLPADIRNWLLKPGGVCLFMIIASKYIFHFFYFFSSDQNLITAMAVGTDFLIGLFLMTFIGVLKPDELRNMTGIKNKRKLLKH